VAICSTPLRAADGVSNDKIIFGQVATLNGPAQALGQGMREGILAAFEDANRAGGVNGRKLELKSIDDSYEPEKTIPPTMRSWKKGCSLSSERLERQPRRPVNPSQQRPRCRSSVRSPALSLTRAAGGGALLLAKHLGRGCGHCLGAGRRRRGPRT
jgi:hypothetical protein